MIYLPSSKEFKEFRKHLPKEIKLTFSKHAIQRAWQRNIYQLPSSIKLGNKIKAMSIKDNKLYRLMVRKQDVVYIIDSISPQNGTVITVAKARRFRFN